MKKLYLVSTSPRRKDLLSTLGIAFEVVSPSFDEIPTALSPEEESLHFAREKALSVRSGHPDSLLIGCDTLVACGGEKLGKPKDEDDARRILGVLSGKTHQVHSGLVLVDTGTGTMKTHVETSEVTFKTLTPALIDQYLRTGEPFGKAGAYAVQGKARALFIEKVEGDETSVIGLPMPVLTRWLREEGFKIP